MDRDDLRRRIAERFAELESTPWPRGASRLPGIGDADIDLADLEGSVAGLAQSYLQKAPLQLKRIRLSRNLGSTFGPQPGARDDVLKPYRRTWQLIVELSELLAETGKIELEWME